MRRKRSDVPWIKLRGSIVVGLGAGGMPSEQEPKDVVARLGISVEGAGLTCSVLEQGVRGDFAYHREAWVWAVAWEEVGLLFWFKLMVKGNLGYVWYLSYCGL